MTAPNSLTLTNLRTLRDDALRLTECLPKGTVARLAIENLYFTLKYLILVTEEAGASEVSSSVLLDDDPLR